MDLGESNHTNDSKPTVLINIINQWRKHVDVFDYTLYGTSEHIHLIFQLFSFYMLLGGKVSTMV